jgi:hypothetical protein
VWLLAAEFWYNTSLNSALGRSPFEVLYGRQPHTLGITVDDATPATLSSWLQERSAMQELVHQHLLRAQTRMKRQADKRRSERCFEINDWVYLKLQPYVQSSVMSRSHHKLGFKYIGPFQVLGRVGQVAYRLNLPAHSRIHLVVHVSLLKLAKGYQGLDVVPLSVEMPEFRVPQRILQTRGVTKGNRLVQQVLVTWSDLPDELATWEDHDALCQCYPFAPAWGQAGFQGAGNVNSKELEEGYPVQEMASNKDSDNATDDGAQNRPRRVRRPNPFVSGPEWSRLSDSRRCAWVLNNRLCKDIIFMHYQNRTLPTLVFPCSSPTSLLPPIQYLTTRVPKFIGFVIQDNPLVKHHFFLSVRTIESYGRILCGRRQMTIVIDISCQVITYPPLRVLHMTSAHHVVFNLHAGTGKEGRRWL